MNNAVIFRLAQRYTSRRLLQSVLFVLGVALGVAVIIAIDLANTSARRAFQLSTQSITGRATHQIVGSRVDSLPTDLYRQIRIDYGLKESAPIVEDFVRAETFGNLPLKMLGVDVFSEAPFRSYLTNADLATDETDSDASVNDALNAFIAIPNSALMSATLAERFDATVGDEIILRANGARYTVTVVGLLLPSDSVSAQALEDLLLVDIATAQAIVGQPSAITRIDLILPPDYDSAQLQTLIPEGTRLMPVSEQGSTIAQMTEAFDINLQALSLLALVVGAFLIYNTVTFNVVQRRPVIGTLRSLGATRQQIFLLILSEALILGLIGTIFGMGLGIIFGRGAVGIVSQTISDLYYTVNVNRVTVPLSALFKGAAIGLVTSAFAAAIPSWDATRTAPAGIMRRSSIEDQAVKLLPYITVLAVVLNLIGLGLLSIPSVSIWLSFIALFCIVVGSALFTPALLVLVMWAIVPLTSAMFGLLGRMAPRAVSRSLSRTSVAVAALTVAVSVIVGVSVMISSFRNTVADWLSTTLSADIYISPPMVNSNRVTEDMDSAVRDLVRDLPQVVDVSAARAVTATSPTYPDMPPVQITAIDWDIAGENRRFVWNAFPDRDHNEVLAEGYVMVSEPFSYRRDITPENNRIVLQTDAGAQEFEIFGVFYDYSTDQGTVFIDMNVYHQFWDDRALTSVAAYLENPDQIPAVIDQLETDTLSNMELQVQSNRTLREGVFAVFDQAFSITIALRLLATVVAFIGILSALLALQMENTRQYGLMRAVGLTPGQLSRFTLIQTGLMGLVSGLLALPVGLALAAVLVFVVNIRSFGWSMAFMPLPEQMAQAFTVALTAALLAGIYPAWKLSRLITARALRTD